MINLVPRRIKRLLSLGLAATLLNACENGSNNGAPADTSAAKKSAAALIADVNGPELAGQHGLRAQILADASWETSHCARVRISNGHPFSSTSTWQVVLDLGLARLTQISGAQVAGVSGFVTLSPLSGSGHIQPVSGWHEATFCASAPVGARPPVLVSVESDLQAPTSDDFETGLWRVVSRSSRHTMNWRTGGGFNGTAFTGHPSQQWRLAKREDGRYTLALESQKQCLQSAIATLVLGTCGTAPSLWTLDTLRVRSDDRPALYRLRQNSVCLRQNGTTAPVMGACDSGALLYVEPVGYGERKRTVEYELRSLLLIKPSTDVQNPRMIATIPADTINAARAAFDNHLGVWFSRLTDGRIKWVGESVIASPMTAVTTEGGNRLPAAFTMQNDVQRYLPVGKYDSAAVFYASGVDGSGNPVPGGWGWGPGISAESNYTMWVTVNGGAVAAHEWTSWNNEPMEVFIHEPMHGLDSFFHQFGVALPDGWLHAADENLYGRDQDGYMPWYRDYLLGTVIAADDTYRGYGPRAFRHGTPRAVAAQHVRRTVVFMYGQTASGQDMFLRGGIDHAAALTHMGRSCTQSNMQCAIPITHRNLRNATTTPWKNGDQYLDWYGRESAQTLISSGHGLAEGTAADWTTNAWTFGNPLRTVAVDGYGQEPLNRFGSHYWMLDVDMDCSKGFLDPRDGVTRWVEIKSYISNGPGWEGNVAQADRPYASGNHFAKCGKINKFERGSSAVQYFDF